MKRIIVPALLCLVFIAQTTHSQTKPYYGPLLFSMHRDTAVPPIYAGQPAQVTMGYLWLDQLMRQYPEYRIDSFFNTLTWSDTMKTLASVYYQAQADNPISFFLWSGNAMRPNPYKGNPSQAQVSFPKRLGQIVGDTGRTAALLDADVIADVIVGDTICVKDPTAHIALDGVLVNSTILDEIKGKKIPQCVGEDMRTHKRTNKISVLSSGTVPWATHPAPADSGSCLQFDYSPEWMQATFFGQDYGPRLVDSTGGWWIKPGKEYIVFLNFIGIGADTALNYFTLSPSPSFSSGSMYPVINGIVQDPNDDFGLGASAGLSVDVWKSRLRARINKIINP